MKRTRRVNYRLAPAVVKALERLAEDNGTSASHMANYILANALRDELGKIEKETTDDK